MGAWGLVLLVPIYMHPALAVFSACMAVPLLADNHFKAFMAIHLGADVFRKRALEFAQVAGPRMYVAAITASRLCWLGLSALLIVLSRGLGDLLYWVGAGLATANVITILSAMSFVRRYLPPRAPAPEHAA
jgi:hypothetical protein